MRLFPLSNRFSAQSNIRQRVVDALILFFLRFRYPVSMPEDIAAALGIEVSKFITFKQFVSCLTSPSCCPTKLIRFMSRERAEEAFRSAIRKEHFHQNSLFSYYFNEGWMEFVLHFDDQSRLRRLYIHHKDIQGEEGLEITLPNN